MAFGYNGIVSVHVYVTPSPQLDARGAYWQPAAVQYASVHVAEEGTPELQYHKIYVVLSTGSPEQVEFG